MEIKPLNVQNLRAGSGYIPRLILSLDGLAGSGKTTFALSAPKGIFYSNLDKSSAEDVLPKYDGQMILPKNYWHKVATQEEGARVWKEFESDFDDALSTDSVRTVVIDTFPEMRELLLLKYWGKMTQLGNKMMYAAPHQELKQLLNKIKMSNKNAVLIHSVGKVYENDSWNGEYEAEGFKGTPKEAQVIGKIKVELDKEKLPHFKLSITKCSQSIDLLGADLTDESCNFPTLATLIFPDTELSDWE
jgi:hypothetical protein